MAPQLSRRQALFVAKLDIRAPRRASTSDSAGLVVFADPDGERLAWKVTAEDEEGSLYEVIVDADRGSVLARRSLTESVAAATVYENHPGASEGGTPTAVDLQAPEGGAWINLAGAGRTKLDGNNAHAYADVNANDSADAVEEVPAVDGTNWIYPAHALRPARLPRRRLCLGPGRLLEQGDEREPGDHPGLLPRQQVPRLAAGGPHRLRRGVGQLRARELQRAGHRTRPGAGGGQRRQRSQQRELHHPPGRRPAADADVLHRGGWPIPEHRRGRQRRAPRVHTRADQPPGGQRERAHGAPVPEHGRGLERLVRARLPGRERLRGRLRRAGRAQAGTAQLPAQRRADRGHRLPGGGLLRQLPGHGRGRIRRLHLRRPRQGRGRRERARQR